MILYEYFCPECKEFEHISEFVEAPVHRHDNKVLPIGGQLFNLQRTGTKVERKLTSAFPKPEFSLTTPKEKDEKTKIQS